MNASAQTLCTIPARPGPALLRKLLACAAAGLLWAPTAWGAEAAQATPSARAALGTQAVHITPPAQPLPPAWALAIHQLLSEKLPPQDAGARRAEIRLGAPDPRLQLPPCERVEASLPQGSRLSGAGRVALHCTQGARPWRIYIPLVITWYGPALVATTARPAGHVLTAADLATAEAALNNTADANPTLTDPAAAIGRTLATAVTPGQPLSRRNLRARQWFAVGDTVQVRATGPGLTVANQGEALTPGIEGQPARVRVEGGKVITGLPVAERQLEFAL